MTDWWDYEIAFYIKKMGLEPHKARTITLLRWLHHGNLRPLAAVIAEGHEIDQAVLNALAMMISPERFSLGPPINYTSPFRIEAVPTRGHGRPKDVAPWIRTSVLAQTYAKHIGDGKKSDEVFRQIAEAVGVSESTVRQAVSAYRKQLKNKKAPA
jgi:hypothetical protein